MTEFEVSAAFMEVDRGYSELSFLCYRSHFDAFTVGRDTQLSL